MSIASNPPRGRVHPMFSPEDDDLSEWCWHYTGLGYAHWTRNTRGKNYHKYAHRLVLECVIGRPLVAGEVCDHINGNRIDNRRENLRLTDRQGNNQNVRARNPTGLRGVTFSRRRWKWYGSVLHLGKRHHCGTFDTPQEAALASAAKRRELGFLEGTNSRDAEEIVTLVDEASLK